MFHSYAESLIIFIIVSTLLITLLISFITYIVYQYQQKQNAYYKNLEELKAVHENEKLQSQVEIQEQTFENISREIHDNIGQKLTLAKLNLNTLSLENPGQLEASLNDSIAMISEAISDLSDISRSMSSEVILNNGLIKALEFEVAQLKKSSIYHINLLVTGDPIFLEAKKELILFRIVQEALNNIMKHAFANQIELLLHYGQQEVELNITDNGNGFASNSHCIYGTGIANMKRRAELLNGLFGLASSPGTGTTITIKIPIDEKNGSV